MVMFVGGLLEVVLVISVINAHFTVINFENSVYDFPQKVAIMANNHDRTLEIRKCVEKCFPAVDIQVVCGFIEDQKVNGFRENAGQHDPAFLAA